MSKYVDGYVLPVKKDKLEEYTKVAERAGQMWMDHGALAVFECAGDDLRPDMGDSGVKHFPDVLNIQDDETVLYSFIIFESREHRDEVNAKVMQDMMEKGDSNEEMPFDCATMIYGGFRSVVLMEK